MAAQIAASVAPCDAPDSEDEAVEDLFGFDFNGIVVCDDSEEESDGDCAPHVPKRRVGAEIPRVDAASLAPGEYSLQIQGSKEFTLFPPDDARYLYLAARSTVTIGPGDALFVPDGWWHTARCVSEAPSVTLGGNYVDASNYDAFSDAFADYLAVKALGSVGASFLN
ncbi:cupin-like domain-containing protein [Aureococcus anophagefferens]|nr:cupin-like domain-containing protein [Aureococcus anophagefferens]